MLTKQLGKVRDDNEKQEKQQSIKNRYFCHCKKFTRRQLMDIVKQKRKTE